MQSYSASHERDEARFINSGIRRALLAILLCPIPILSQLLAISAYMREATRLTAKHRTRLFFGTLIAVLALLVTIAALFGEVYIYTQRPDIVETVKEKAASIILSDSEDTEYGMGAEGEYYDMGEYTDEMDGDVPDAYSTNDEDWIVDENGEWIYVGSDMEEEDDDYSDAGDFEDEEEYEEDEDFYEEDEEFYEEDDEYDAEFDSVEDSVG